MSNRLRECQDLQRHRQRGLRKRRKAVAKATAMQRRGRPARSLPVRVEAAKPWPAVSHPDKRTAWVGLLGTMLHWRRKTQGNAKAADAVQELGQRWVKLVASESGLTEQEQLDLWAASGLKERPVDKLSVRGWEQLLRTYGPLWVIWGGGDSSLQGAVVVGLVGSGQPRGTQFELLNPRSGKPMRVSYERLVARGATRLIHWAEGARRTQKLAGRTEPKTQAMQVSDQGLAFIALQEGFQPRPFDDAAGDSTVGHGHRLHPGATDGSEPAEFVTGIDRAAARRLLAKDLVAVAQLLNQELRVPVKQHQFDALASFAFQAGSRFFSASSVLASVNGNRPEAVDDALLKFSHAGGRQQPDLHKRRQAEGRLFNDGKYTPANGA